jgi:hypothetical protein
MKIKVLLSDILHLYNEVSMKEEFEDTKGVIIIRKSKKNG